MTQDEREQMRALEAMLRGLMKGTHSSLSITFNEEHGPNYMTAAEYAETYPDLYGPEHFWISDEERTKALETNSVWTVHWYPDTPVGFLMLRASSLEALIDALANGL